MSGVLHSIDQFEVTFDDESLVANAGLITPATLMSRLRLEGLVDATVRLSGRVGGSRPGRKVCSLVTAMLAGGSHIDHADVLRAGGTERVLPFRVMAPSTLGTFLRSFTFGHVRQLDKVIAESLRRAWALGAGPGNRRLVIDVDSTICEVYGKQKQGAGYGYTKVLGYHPLLATRADTGEVLHARLRQGQANTARGARRFVEELIARVRHAGAIGELVARFDAGFWSYDTIATLARLGVRYTMAVHAGNTAIVKAIATIDEKTWIAIGYTADGEAQVSECVYKGRRLIVRRTRLTDKTQAELWPNWRHHAFLTDLTDDTVTIDKFHRHHAVVELAIRDLKEGAGLEHVPSGNFSANAAWLACAILAHNLIRWNAKLGDVHHDDQLTVARTIRTQLIAVPARIVNLHGQHTLRFPARWPWADTINTALAQLRAIPQLT